MLSYNCTLSLLYHSSNILIMAFVALHGPCYQSEQAQQYTLRIWNFSHLGSLKRDHIKYHFSGREGESEKGIKEEICLSVNPDPLNLFSSVEARGGGQKSGPGSVFCKSSDEMLTKQPIFCNFPAAVSQQLGHSEPPHFKQRHAATSDMHPVPERLGPGRKTVTVVPFRSGGCHLRRRPHERSPLSPAWALPGPQ